MCYPSNRIQQANGMNGTGLIVVSPFWQSFSRNSRVVRCLQLVPTRVLLRPISTKLWRHSGTLPNRKTPPLPRGKLVQKPTYCNPQFIICSSHHTNCKLKRCAKSVHMHPKSNSKNKTTNPYQSIGKKSLLIHTMCNFSVELRWQNHSQQTITFL